MRAQGRVSPLQHLARGSTRTRRWNTYLSATWSAVDVVRTLVNLPPSHKVHRSIFAVDDRGVAGRRAVNPKRA